MYIKLLENPNLRIPLGISIDNKRYNGSPILGVISGTVIEKATDTVEMPCSTQKTNYMHLSKNESTVFR